MGTLLNARQVAKTRTLAQGSRRNRHIKNAVTMQDSDESVKVESPGQSFCYEVCTLTTSTSSKYNSNHKNWFNKSVMLFYILLAFLSLSLHEVTAEERCTNRPASLTVRYKNCIPRIALVPVCSGTCRSYTMTDIEAPSILQRSCTCCKPIDYTNSIITVRCPRPRGKIGYMNTIIRVKLPRTCMCRPCAPLPEIIPSEFIED